MKPIVSSIIILFILVGCKPAKISFKPDQINTNYVRQLLTIANQPNASEIKGGKIFVADLSEDYVERDGIGEKTIINDNSTKDRLGIPLLDKRYKLFIISTTGTVNNESIFIPAIFDASNNCIGLGPAMIGVFGPGELTYFKRLTYYPKKKKGKIDWVYDKKGSEFKKSASIFDPYDRSRTKINIIYQLDEMDKDIAELKSFRVTKILQISENRFGGNKPLIYNISSVFEDPDALFFLFLRNL